MFHPLAWISWVLGGFFVLSATHNPFYLALVLVVIAMIEASIAPQSETGDIILSPWRFGLIVVPLSMLFSALTSQIGATVLFTIPGQIPYLSGPITLESLSAGALNGLVLTGILAAFAVFNMAVPVSALVRIVPRAFHSLAVITSIAVTFVPVTLRQFRQIREAQAVRGHRIRGVRDWLPLFVPLLVGGIERALSLAEAMAARGFASSEQTRQGTDSLWLALGLGLLLAGLVADLAWGASILGIVLMATGGLLVLITLWFASRRIPHTSYRRHPWRGADTLLAMASMAVALFFLVPLPNLGRDTLPYYPYPQIHWPAFDPIPGAVILLLSMPLWLSVRRHD
jgi:energy-coupling factor transport system permease protein